MEKKYLSIDLGGSFTKWAIFNQDFKILDSGKFSSFPDKNYVLDVLLTQLSVNIKKILSKNKVEFVGISTFGTVDSDGKYIDSWVENHMGWNINDWFKKEFNLRSEVNKDGDCFLLGEMQKNNFITKNEVIASFAIGTGIAGSIFYNGKILKGQNYNSAAFSDIQIKNSKMSRLANSLYLIDNIKSLSKENENLDIENLYKDFNKGLKTPQTKVLSEWYENIALGIINVVVVIDAKKIIIGGGIVESKHFNVDYIMKIIKDKMETTHIEGLKIYKSSNGNYSQLIGAMNLAFKKFK